MHKVEKEISARKKLELSSLKRILQDSRRWQEAQLLREYVKQVEEKAMAEGKPTKEIMAINAMVFKKIKNYESN